MSELIDLVDRTAKENFLRERGWLSCADPDFEDKLVEVEDDIWAKLGLEVETEFTPVRLRRMRKRKLWLLTNGFEYMEERIPEAYPLADKPPEDGMPPVKQWNRVPAGTCRTLEEALEIEKHRPTTAGV